MSGWLFIAATAVGWAGVLMVARGGRRVREGQALAHAASTLESQLTNPPRFVIEETVRGHRMAREGVEEVRRGVWFAAFGFSAALAIAVLQLVLS